MSDWIKIEPLPLSREEGEIWEPAIGNEIEGSLEKVVENIGKFKKSKLYHVKTSEGKLLKIWGSTVLDNRLKNCVPGMDMVKILFKGDTLAANGNRYKTYDVWHKPINSETEESQIPF